MYIFLSTVNIEATRGNTPVKKTYFETLKRRFNDELHDLMDVIKRLHFGTRLAKS